MRIGTWNIENHQDSRRMDLQHAAIAETGADVFVITEVNAAFDVGPGGLRSAPIEGRANGGSWVAIVGNGVTSMHNICPPTGASVAGQVDVGAESLIIVGSVLPWRTAAFQAPEMHQGDETYVQMFERTLNEHSQFVLDLQKARPDALVVWAGDFNQTLSGSNAGASDPARALLIRKLDELNFVAWNEHMAHANPDLKAIDLICGPSSRSVLSIERIDPVRDGVPVSDHAGYIVEVASAR